MISMTGDMKRAAKIMKALSDRNRLRIMKLLQHRKGCCVCEIREILGVVQSTVSVHLRILEEANLIISQREGKWVNFFLNAGSPDEKERAILKIVREWMNDDPQVLEDRTKLDSVSRSTLCG